MDLMNVGSYPILMGVSPDMPSDAEVTFEHLESVDETEDRGQQSYTNNAQCRPCPIPSPLRMNPNPYYHGYQQQHQDNCSHSTVTRQWRIDQYETCNNCGLKPSFRWFYSCTEDETDLIAAKDREPLLSKWMTGAILEGEYSEEQMNILLKQNLEVLDMCEMERTAPLVGPQFMTSQTTQQQYSYHYEAHQSNFTAETGSSSSIHKVQPRPPRCHYRACFHCDRKLQERTWVSLNAVCDDPNIKPPSAWDLWETPIADVEHVRNLGLRPVRPPPPPPHSSQYAQHVYRASHRRRMRRSSGQYFAGYESSLSVGLTTNLTTIEELCEEMESLALGVITQRNRRLDAELSEVSVHQNPEYPVSNNEDNDGNDLES